MHHLFAEVIDNSMDEAVAGHASCIEVEFSKDGFLSVTDNGRGIPVDPHPKFKKSALEVIMTTLHSGGKFESKVYNTSGGLHGVGVSVVNALSETLEVEVARGQQLYCYGVQARRAAGQAQEARPGHEPARHHHHASSRTRRSSARAAPSSRRGSSRWRAPRPTCSAASRSAGAAIPRSSPTTRRQRRIPLPRRPQGLPDERDRGSDARHQGDLRRPHRRDQRPRLGRMGGRLDRR